MSQADDVIFRIHRPDEAVYRRNSLPIQVVFGNEGDMSVTLLDLFEPLPVFFETELVAADGTLVSTAGMGKADIPYNKLRYIKLEPGEFLIVKLDLAPVLEEAIVPGRYTLKLTYHNQYGTGCFQGMLESHTIEIDIAE